MANTRITRNISSGSTTNKFTLSFWIKKSATHTNDEWLFENYNSGSARTWVRFNLDTGSPRLEVSEYTGSYIFRKVTNRVFRDVGAFYHIHIQFDSTQSTDTNRLKIYINGVQETSFAQTNHPALNATSIIGNTGNQYLGYSENSNGAYFSGIMSHAHFCHGYSYGADSFGSTDSTTGEWKINTSPSVTYGALGWFWLKDTNATTDSSPNSNTFTVGSGTLTKTEDSPSNVFATMNSLDNFYAGSTLSNGNNTVATVSSNAAYNPSNFAIKTGKWYWEVKLVACSAGNGSEATIIGMSNQSPTSSGYGGSIQGSGGLGIRGNGKMWAGGSEETGWSAIAVGNIAMIAVDFDNGKFYAGINGTWGNSGDPTSGSTGTGAYSFTVGSDAWFPGVNQRETSQTATFNLNFGNGYFGTTAVSSAGTNASGIGIFEYDVPTGFTALSTKGLNL